MSLKDRAIALRLDNDLSVRVIADRLGVARSTVGDWVKGIGEPRYYRTCAYRMCGERFTTHASHTQFCSKPCREREQRCL